MPREGGINPSFAAAAVQAGCKHSSVTCDRGKGLVCLCVLGNGEPGFSVLWVRSDARYKMRQGYPSSSTHSTHACKHTCLTMPVWLDTQHSALFNAGVHA